MDDKDKYLQDLRRIHREQVYAREQQAGLDALAAQNAPQINPSSSNGASVNNDTVGNGFFGHLKDSADAGFFGSLAGTARFVGEFSPFGGDWANSLGDYFDEKVKQNTPMDALTGTDWFASAIGNAIGSGAAGMLEGAVLLGAGSAMGTALVPAGTAATIYKAMRQVPAIGQLVKATHKMWKSNFGKMQLAEVAGSPIEATAEAGNLITEMRNEGYTDDEIRSAAIQSAKYNTGWLTVANMVGGRINNAIGSEGIKAGLKGAVKAAAKGAATEGVGEAVQEYGQSYIHDTSKGVEFNREDAEESALQALVGSAVLGGIGNVAKPYINNTNTPKATTAKAETEAAPVVNQEAQKARNVLIDQRETLSEDDPEYGRLTDLLNNGSDDEIIKEANAIVNGTKTVEEPEAAEVTEPEAVEETEPAAEETEPVVEEPETEEPVGDIVDTINLEPPTFTQGETGGKQEDGENNVPPQGQTVESPKNTSDNGKSQENGASTPENQSDNKDVAYTERRHKLTQDAKTALEKLQKDGTEDWDAAYDNITAPLNTAIANGELTVEDANTIKKWVDKSLKDIQKARKATPAKPSKTPFGEAIDQTTAIRKQGKKPDATTAKPVEPAKPAKPVEPAKPAEPTKPAEPAKPVEPSEPVKAEPPKVDEWGYKETLGDYTLDRNDRVKGDRHPYKSKDGKKSKIIRKNDDGSYSVETITRDKNGDGVSRFAAFDTLADAEDFVATSKKPADYQKRTWWAWATDKDGAPKIIRGNTETIKEFKEYVKKSGYEVNFASTPETFNQKLEEYQNKPSKPSKPAEPSKPSKTDKDAAPKTRDETIGANTKKPDKQKETRVNYTSEELEKRAIFLGKDKLEGEAISEEKDDETTNQFASLVKKVFNVDVIFDPQEAVKRITTYDRNGNVLKPPKLIVENGILMDPVRKMVAGGFYDKKRNFIYIDRDYKFSAASTVHELTHVWWALVASKNPKLIAAGKKLLMKTKAWEDVKRVYEYTDDNDPYLIDEVLAQLSGVNFQHTIANLEKQGLEGNLLHKLKAWFKKFWQTVKNLLQSEDERLAKMTLEEFVNMPLADLLSKAEEIEKAEKTEAAKPLPAENASGRYDAYVKRQKKAIKSTLSKPETKTRVIEISLSKPELFHNTEGAKNLYRVKYINKDGRLVSEGISAAEHHAIEYLSGVQSKPYTKKTDIAVEVARRADEIRKDVDYQDFAQSRPVRVLGFMKNIDKNARIVAISDALDNSDPNIDGDNIPTIAEDVREVVIKDLASGTEDAFEQYYDNNLQWLDDEFGEAEADQIRKIITGYYEFLKDKYKTETGDATMFTIVKAGPDQSAQIQELDKRLKKGESRLSIWEDTGWYKSKDGNWKYFIDDDLDKIDFSKVSDKNNQIQIGATTTVGELYDNPELFKKYPYLSQVKVVFKKGISALRRGGSLDDTITLYHRAAFDVSDIKRTLLHELEHQIQDAEGMATGTAPNNVLFSFQDTISFYWDRAGKISKAAQEYLNAYADWVIINVNPFEEPFERGEKADRKQALAETKNEFLESATSEQKKRLKVLLDGVNTVAKKAKASLDNTTYFGNNGNDQAYMDALGEQEARLVAHQANISLSEKDKSIKQNLMEMIAEMPDEAAELATNFLYYTSSLSHSDKNDSRQEEDWAMELSMFPETQEFLDAFYDADNRIELANSLAHLNFIMGHDDRSIVFLGNEKKKKREASVTETSKTSLRERGRDAVVTKKPKSFWEEVKSEGFLKAKWKEFYRDWVDKNNSINDIDLAVSNALGRELSDEERIYDKVQMVASRSSGLATSLISGSAQHIKALNSTMNNVPMRYTVTLKQVLDEVNAKKMDKAAPEYLKENGFENWVEAFGAYLGWRRLSEMIKTHNEAFKEEYKKWVEGGKKGKEPVFKPYKTPNDLTSAELQYLIGSAPKEFDKAARMYYMLNDNILSIMEDAGLIDDKTHELLNTKYKEYCPLMRDFSDTAAADTFIEGITNGGTGVANVSSMLKRISLEGSDRAVINPLESTIKTITVLANRAERNKAGQHLVRMMRNAELEGYIEKLGPNVSADAKNCIFTIMFNGKKVAYKVAQEFYTPIVGYPQSTGSLLLALPRTVASCLRTGATISPSFIVRNLFRDTVFAGISSKNGFIPIVDTIRGARELSNNKEFRALFEASGVVAFNQYGDAEAVYNSLQDLNDGNDFSIYKPKDILIGVFKAGFKGKFKSAFKLLANSLEQLSSYVESATRAGEFKRALDNGKSVGEAARNARELTLDFSRSGIVGREVNRYVPFFNACIQGGDKMTRLLINDPVRTSAMLATYIILPSVALWALNHDEDWYEELEPSIKYTNWCLPNGIRIPKPQEAGVLFGSGIEAMLDQAYINDPKAMKNWISEVGDVITPSIIPTIALPLIEWLTNYSFFKGRDLVPQRLQRMPDELQYSSGTSEASKFVGKHTYTSPIKIDNLVRGYIGTMGMFVWQSADWLAAEKQNLPAKKLSEMQFIRDFNVTAANRTRYINDFYELQQKANQQQAGYGLKGKPSAAVKVIRKAGQTISELNKQIRVIETSDKYTPQRKRELIDAKKERINKTAKLVVDRYGKDFL